MKATKNMRRKECMGKYSMLSNMKIIFLKTIKSYLEEETILE